MLRHQKNIVFKQGGLHLLAAPGLCPLHQCGHRTHGPENATHDVVDARARPQRIARPAGHIGQPTHHLHHFVQRGAVVVGAGEKAFVADVNEAGITRAQGGVVKTEFLHGLGFEVFAHDVGGGDQAQHHLAAAYALQVQRQTLFVAVEQRIKARPAAEQPAGAVAGQRLDLDHVCAHITQRHPAGWPHHHVGELDHPDAVQGKVGVAWEGHRVSGA